MAKGEYPDDYCYTMSASEVDRLTPMSLHFSNGVQIDFGPRQYSYELRRGVWCLGVFDNEHNGAVIGASNMRNHEAATPRSSTQQCGEEVRPPRCPAAAPGHL